MDLEQVRGDDGVGGGGGQDARALSPAGECGITPRGGTRRFAAGVCLGTTGLAGLPRVANVRAQEKHKRRSDRPCRDEHPAGRARSLPPDFSRLIATVWRSRRSRRPHGAGLVGRTSQPLHTRRVLERITELAHFVKRNRRPGFDPGRFRHVATLQRLAPHRPSSGDERGPGSTARFQRLVSDDTTASPMLRGSCGCGRRAG